MPKILAAAACLCVSLLSGCVSSQAYWTTPTPHPGLGGSLVPAADKPTKCQGDPGVAIVEFDEVGIPMNRSQIDAAVAKAKAAAANGGTVLVYAHGWHHNANCEDGNLQKFRGLVERVSKYDGEADANRVGAGVVQGIYIAWRGEAIPSHSVGFVPSLFTFWDRKAAAQRIGAAGGVFELLSRLSRVRHDNSNSRLIVEGHSFGGALLYSAFSGKLIEQIMRDGVPDSARDKESVDGSDAGDRGKPPTADLLVLLNPAFEAARLRPQFDLARSQEYPAGKAALPPRLVIITSAADSATGSAFPAGRTLSSIFDAYLGEPNSADRSAEYHENIDAVGHYLPLITHELVVAKAQHDPFCPDPPGLLKGNKVLPRFDSLALMHDMGETNSLCVLPAFEAPAPIPRLVLTRCDKPGDCSAAAGDQYLTRGLVRDGLVPYRLPIMNIRTTEALSDGHNDIWKDPLQSFIVQLSALAIKNPDMIPQMRQPSIMGALR